MLRDVERERGLSHGGPRGEDEEVAAVHPAGHFVQLGEAGADALETLAGVEEGVDAAFVAFKNGMRVEQAGFDAGFAQFEQRLFGAGEDLIRMLLAQETPVHHVLRGEDDTAQDGLILHDAEIGVEIRNWGRPSSSETR